MMRTPKFVLLVAFVAALTMSVPAAADTIITQVSPAGSGTLLSYNTGTAGTLADPWTIAESLLGPPFVIELNGGAGAPLGPGNPTASGHTTGRWFHKTVLNESGVNWTSFELELQIELGLPSLDGDGLSFAQGSGFTFSSNLFPVYTAIEDIRDYLNFHGGVVMPGQTVEFTFAITDNSANNPFWLLETPNKAEVPEPGSMLLLGTGLVGLAGAIRRRLRK